MKRFFTWLGLWVGLLIGTVILAEMSSSHGDTADQVGMILFFLAIFAFFWPILKWFVKLLFNPVFWLFVFIFRKR